MTLSPARRLDTVEKICAPKPRQHLLWWDEWESLADVTERARRMIAEGKANESDEFSFVTWNVPHPGEDAKDGEAVAAETLLPG